MLTGGAGWQPSDSAQRAKLENKTSVGYLGLLCVRPAPRQCVLLAPPPPHCCAWLAAVPGGRPSQLARGRPTCFAIPTERPLCGAPFGAGAQDSSACCLGPQRRQERVTTSAKVWGEALEVGGLSAVGRWAAPRRRGHRALGRGGSLSVLPSRQCRSEFFWRQRLQPVFFSSFPKGSFHLDVSVRMRPCI